MSANLHELTKQLDVLSWNSRSVLNALIRSVMATGSSDGFTVNRAGQDITLSREDISRIYDFYEAWESTGYATGVDGKDFYALVDEVGSRYEDGALVASLVKHAQVILMDNTNVDSKDNPTFWLDKVYSMDNPKWFTNTAPIPLSIRTPIYDENLSTKHYDEYETYLFPRGYFAIDTFGYSGDGIAHSAGGESWTFDVDRVFTLNSDRVVVGKQDKNVADKLEISYSLNSPLHSFAGGYNSFAFAPNSFSYGDSNQTYGEAGSIIGGRSNNAMGAMSGILAGSGNTTISNFSGIVGGATNVTAGMYSFAANSMNHVGGYNYRFTRQVVSTDPQTECAPTYTDPETGCTYVLSGNETSVGSVSLGQNEVFISNEEIGFSMVPMKKEYSTGYDYKGSGRLTTALDFRVRDKVVIHSYTYGDTENGVMVKAGEPMVATVSAVTEAYNGDTVVGYIVRLDKDISAANIANLGTSVVTGGKICRMASFEFAVLNPKTGLSTTSISGMNTQNSGAFGYNNISCGDSQLVVGSCNQELQRPRFIVGVGPTSYINDGNSANWFRQNAFVVAPGYLYGSTSSYVMFGASNFTTASLDFFGDEVSPDTRRTDEDFYLYGVEKYSGFYAYSSPSEQDTQDEATRAVLRVSNEKTVLVRGENGLQMQKPYKTYMESGDWNIYTELFSNNGSVVIRATERTTEGDPAYGDGWLTYYASRFDTGSDKRNMELWAKDGLGICGNKVMITAGSVDTTADGFGMGELEIRAYPYKSLTAWPIERTNSTPVRKGLFAYPYAAGVTDTAGVIGKRIDTISDCGHYYGFVGTCGLTTADPDFGSILSNGSYNAMHSFVSSEMMVEGGEVVGYDVASLVLPGAAGLTVNSRDGSADLPHPFVSVAVVNADETSTSRDGTSANGFIVKELAYRSDADNASVKLAKNIGVPAYVRTQSSVTAYDSDPSVRAATNFHWYELSDPYLESLSGTSNIFDDMNHQSVDGVGHDYAHTVGKIIKNPSSFANYAGRCTTTVATSSSGTYAGNQFFVNGVKINPMMRAELRSGSRLTGLSYLAYGSKSIRDIGEPGLNELEYVYKTQLENASVPSDATRSLYTSKYSAGIADSTIVSDLADIWVVCYDSTNTKLVWRNMLSNVLLTYNAGRLSMQFTVNRLKMNSFSALPIANSNNIAINGNISDAHEWDTAGYSLIMDIPIDPTISNYISPVIGGGDSVASMHGYTSVTNAMIAHDETGIHSVSANILCTPSINGVDGNELSGTSRLTPIIRLNLGNVLSAYNNMAIASIPCYLEGLVNYER